MVERYTLRVSTAVHHRGRTYLLYTRLSLNLLDEFLNCAPARSDYWSGPPHRFARSLRKTGSNEFFALGLLTF